MKKISYLLLICFIFSCTSEGKKEKTTTLQENQSVSNEKLNRVEPPNWWIGFKNPNLQLLIHEKDISNYTPSINYGGITIKKVQKAQSSNYLFIDVNIDKTTKEGKFDIVFKDQNGNEKRHTYELKSREKPYTLDLSRFAEIGLEGKTLKNVLTNEEIIWKNTLELNKKESLLLTTKN